jgi:hypothetical protein
MTPTSLWAVLWYRGHNPHGSQQKRFVPLPPVYTFVSVYSEVHLLKWLKWLQFYWLKRMIIWPDNAIYSRA